MYYLRLINLSILALLLSALIISCSDDDPVSPQEEHLDAVGTVIYDGSGAEVFRIFRAETSDTLYAVEGELTDHFEVKFLNDDEEAIDPPSGDEHSLSYEIANEVIVAFWQHEGLESGFEFHLRGLEEGHTTMELFVMHSGHSDYRTGPFPVVVTHGPHGEEIPVGLNLYYEDDMQSPVVSVNNSNVNGNLSVNAGENSEHTVIRFLIDEGEEFQPHADDFYFEVEVHSGESHLTATVEDDEPWVFFLTGVSAGDAEIEIMLYEWHDGHGDVIWTSEHIPVTIN